jgi:hypothetical protein
MLDPEPVGCELGRRMAETRSPTAFAGRASLGVAGGPPSAKRLECAGLPALLNGLGDAQKREQAPALQTLRAIGAAQLAGRPFGGLKATVLVLAALLLAGALAQVSSPGGVVKGAFVFPEYDKANPMRVRSLLSGVGAKPLANGQVWFNQLRLETYAEEGNTNFVVIGTNCVFDPKNKLASSSDRLEVHGGDGRFFIEGVGFLWRQTNWHLTISNRVHVRLHGLEAAAAQRQP